MSGGDPGLFSMWWFTVGRVPEQVNRRFPGPVAHKCCLCTASSNGQEHLEAERDLAWKTFIW
jgi:hypothetical protein